MADRGEVYPGISKALNDEAARLFEEYPELRGLHDLLLSKIARIDAGTDTLRRHDGPLRSPATPREDN